MFSKGFPMIFSAFWERSVKAPWSRQDTGTATVARLQLDRCGKFKGSKWQDHLGRFDHDLTVLPHWKWWFLLGESWCFFPHVIIRYMSHAISGTDSLEVIPEMMPRKLMVQGRFPQNMAWNLVHCRSSILVSWHSHRICFVGKTMAYTTKMTGNSLYQLWQLVI